MEPLIESSALWCGLGAGLVIGWLFFRHMDRLYYDARAGLQADRVAEQKSVLRLTAAPVLPETGAPG